MHDPFDDLMVRVRCPECRINFRVRVQRLLFAAPVKCLVCHTETSFFVARHGASWRTTSATSKAAPAIPTSTSRCEEGRRPS